MASVLSLVVAASLLTAGIGVMVGPGPVPTTDQAAAVRTYALASRVLVGASLAAGGLLLVVFAFG